MDIKGMMRIGILALLPMFLVSCGGSKGKITDVRVDQSVVGSDSYLHLSATLDLGNIYLPSFKSEIMLPGRGPIGEVELGADFVDIALNLSEVVPQLETGGLLPNGAKLPLIKDNPVVVLPLGRSNIKVFVSLVHGATALGISIPVKELDEIGRYSAFFPPFQVKTMTVAAGVYSSDSPGLSGIGAFFDLTKVLGMGVTDSSSGSDYLYVPMGANESYELGIQTEVTNSKTQRKIDKVLYRLHRKKKVIELN